MSDKEKNIAQLMLTSSENLTFSGVRVLTGTPGAGKTLRMVYLMEKAHEQGMNVFVSNNDTIKFPFLQYLDDPRQWATLPTNSVLFVDEGQKYFRQRRGNTEVPDYLTDMETLRHRGISIVITTQKPTFLDTHIRGLTGIHEHLIPGLGSADEATVHQWRELQEDVKSPSLLETSMKFTWPYPKHLYSMYTSAEVHTKTKFLPTKVKLVYALGALFVLVVLFIGYRFISRGSIAPVPSDLPKATALANHGEGEAPKAPKTIQDYLALQTPVITAQPWTAPQFARDQAEAHPMIYCMAGGLKTDNPSCRCLTEQGTRYYLQFEQCVIIAKDGLYNPHARPAEQAPASQAPPPVAPVAAQPPTASISGPQVQSEAFPR